MGHYYCSETGAPRYQVKTADGSKLRDTTIADARKLKLLPSVTEIMKVASQDGLIFWQQNQVLEAVLDLGTGLASKNLDQWKGMIIQESQKIGKEAAKKGSEIHDALEQAFTHGYVDEECHFELYSFIVPIYDFLHQTFGTGFIPEKSFAHKLGFGGKVDLHRVDKQYIKCTDNTNFEILEKTGIVIDFKTKPDKAFSKQMKYDNHDMQLGAYRIGLDIPQAKCYNLFISHETPGNFELVEASEQDLKRGEGMFKSLLEFWKLKNKYDSAF